MEHLHKGAKWVFRIRGYFGAFFFMIFLSWFVFPIVGLLAGVMFGVDSSAVVAAVVIGFVVYIVAIIIIAEIYSRMAYNRWLYEFTPHNLKLERGIIWKRYSNVPYERVQNVDIQRGILARMLGFSTIDIQTAGFHGGYGRRGMPGSEGHIPAVSVEGAEKIREFLMKKISKSHSGQGM